MAKSANERQADKNAYLAQRNHAAANIAPLPAVVDQQLRDRCQFDLKLFCETYFAAVFCKPWSSDHLKVIQIIQDAILRGGLSAVAMPRGSGKTSLSVAAAVWALVYGHRSFVVLIGATETLSKRLLKNLSTHFTTNDRLADDFPEVCYPVRRLGGQVQRAKSQHIDGAQTLIGWTKTEMVLPTVAGSKAAGACVAVAGITGSIRGLQVVRPSDGAVVRPDFVLIDDPQTRESAFSVQQTYDRLNIIYGDILGLAGQGKISAVCPCTVINKDDLAERILDREKSPDWQGIRTKLMEAMPTDHAAWEAYAQVRADALRAGDREAANAYYIANRAALDAGAIASWPDCYDADEVSAIQHAMNLKLRNEAAFAAEYQNAPVEAASDQQVKLTTPDVLAKVAKKESGLIRRVIPKGFTRLVAFIDVQGSVLFYVVCAFDEKFACHVVDYGAWPDQGRAYFGLRDLSKTLAQVAPPRADLQGQLHHGLTSLVADLTGRTWATEDDSTLTLGRILIDSGYEQATIQHFCRTSTQKAILIPSKGLGVTADRKPLNDYKPEVGVRMGWNWRHKVADQQIHYDTNEWKSFVAGRVLLPVGNVGTLTIFNATEVQHQLFVEHLMAETGLPMESKAHGRTVTEWKNQFRRENHWWDCLVGCFVAASELGVVVAGHQSADPEVKKLRPRRRAMVAF